MLGSSSTAMYSGSGTNYLVETPAGVLYCVYIIGNTVAFKKSTTNGLSWSTATTIYTGPITQLSIWYDRWSDISAGLIHCVYAESTTDEVFYRSINTESSDALGTQTTVFSGASTATGCAISVTRARGGNIYCLLSIDAGAENEWAKSTDTGATWTYPTDTGSFEAATNDAWILLPGWAADNQDIMCFFWDTSANEISRKLWDDSAGAWSETSIAASMTKPAGSSSFPNFAAAVDITNSQNLLVAWSANDTLNADLRCWKVTESAITEVTNVVLNSTDDQSLCAICIELDTGYWHVFYTGKSDGSETVGTSVNVYKKVSVDGGTTWGSETLLTERLRQINWLTCVPRPYNHVHPLFLSLTLGTDVMTIATAVQPKANYIIGI